MWLAWIGRSMVTVQRLLFVAGMVYVVSFAILLLTKNYRDYFMLAHLTYGAVFFPAYYWFVVRGPKQR